MKKKGFIGKLRTLSQPTGKPRWKSAIKSIILMVFAGLIAKFIGFEQGIKAIMFSTLIATIIIDVPLPLRKIVPMVLIGFLMTLLAFISSSLALASLPVFLFFTVVWAFFSLSLYIFSETAGLFGFIIFSGYFMSVLLVNRDVSTMDWGLYIILAYLIGSILLIPKLGGSKKDLLKMISSPFSPETSLENVLSIRQALSDLSLDSRDYELFRVGTYLTGFREYSKLVLSRLSGKSLDLFEKFIDTSNETSQGIASSIKNDSKPVETGSIDDEIENMEKILDSGDPDTGTIMQLSNDIKNIIKRANALLLMEYPTSEKKKIISPRNTLKNVLSANFNLDNLYIRHALRFTLAMTLGLLAVYLSHDRDAIWITMGILIIIKPDVTSTINNIILRVSFNFIAIILAIAIGFVFPHQMLVWLGFLMLFLFRAFYPTYMGLSVMTITVFVVLLWPTGLLWENAVARMIDICVGAIIAFFCSYMILPSRMKVNLPEQVARNIRTNSEYLKNVIHHQNTNYNHGRAVSCFRNYMLEEKNLESSIKKIEDTFEDVNSDVQIYHGLNAINRKLGSDITAVAAIIESGESLPDISRFKEQTINALNELALSVEKNIILPRAKIDRLQFNAESSDVPDNLENYLNWIISDIKHLQAEVEIAFKSRTLEKYRNII